VRAGRRGRRQHRRRGTPEELQARFEHYCTKLSADFDFGKIEAIQALAKVKKKDDQARAVIAVGIIIGGADGRFDDSEKQVVRQACHALGIPPAEFDL
jgi:tellurite resistance protein TerB